MTEGVKTQRGSDTAPALCNVGVGMYLAVNIQVFIVSIIKPLAPSEYQMAF